MLEKRQYVQLIDVLGEIGGFMEIIYSFFSLICSLIVDILYKKKLQIIYSHLTSGKN